MAADDEDDEIVEEYIETSVLESPGDVVAETASKTTLDRQDFSAMPQRTAEDLLKIVPGLTLIQHGSEGKGYQYFLRGFDAIHGADLAIDVEGILLNEWSNVHAQGYLDLGLIIADVVDSVEVTKGPFALEQAEFAMAGSASYRLSPPSQLENGGLWYTAGTTNRHQLVGLLTNEERDLVAGELTYDAGFAPRRGLIRGIFNAKSRLYKTDAVEVALLNLAGLAAFQTPTAARDDDIAAGRILPYESYDQTLGGRSLQNLYALTITNHFGPMSQKTIVNVGYRELFLRENFTGYLIDPVHGDRREQYENRFSFGAKTDFSIKIIDDLYLLTGFHLRGDVLRQYEDHVADDDTLVTRMRDTDATQLLGGMTLGMKYSLDHRLTLRLGVRGDVVFAQLTEGGSANDGDAGWRFVASPRLSMSYTPFDGYNLFLSYGRGFRPPEVRGFGSSEKIIRGIAEEVDQTGRTEITTSDSYEVGVTTYPNRYFGAQVSTFGTFIQRESIFDHVAGTNLEYNATRRLGVEAVVYIDPVSWMSLIADLTYVNARFSGSGRPVPYAPWLVGGVRTTFRFPFGLEAGLRLMVVAPRHLPHGATGATLTTLDGTISYRYSHWLFRVGIENIPNLAVREGEFHYASVWDKDNASQIPTLTTILASPLQARLTVGIEY